MHLAFHLRTNLDNVCVERSGGKQQNPFHHHRPNETGNIICSEIDLSSKKSDMAKQIGRSTIAVLVRRQKLGLRKKGPPWWRKEECIGAAAKSESHLHRLSKATCVSSTNGIPVHSTEEILSDSCKVVRACSTAK